MGRNNIKQKNEEYAKRSKARKAETIARQLQQVDELQKRFDLNNLEEDTHVKEQIRIEAKNLIVAILLILFMLAVPSFESSRKSDIIEWFGWVLN